MPRQLKDYDLVIDYAAFMLAIVFARHLVDHSNVHFQWSAETLSVNMKKLEFGRCANFAVNSTALSHGFHLFGTPIKDRGIERVIVQREGSAIPKYFTLDGHSISHEIKFTSYSNPCPVTESELLGIVKTLRDNILKRCDYSSSSHDTACSVFSSLYFSIITSYNLNYNQQVKKIDDKPVLSNEPPQMTAKIFPKSPSRMNKRTIKRSVNNLIIKIENDFGEKHSLFYLESAVTTSKKRRRLNKTPDSQIMVGKKLNTTMKQVMKRIKTNTMMNMMEKT